MDDLQEYIPAGLMNIGPDKRVPARLTKKFEPKNWKPLYDLFVYHHCLGKSNIWIAGEFNKTPQQVCNVLRSNQGQVRIKIIKFNLDSIRDATIQTRMSSVADKFMKRIETVVEDDELFTKAPFAFVDRGLAIIKGLGKLSADSPNPGGGSTTIHSTQIHNGNITQQVFSDKALTELKDALQFSNEAKALHEAPPSELAAVEVKQLPAKVG
jgi:hypothetical protein